MVTIAKVSPASAEARAMIRELDLDLTARYPDSPIFGIKPEEFERAGGYFVVAVDSNEPLGCGAFRPIDQTCAELKRMYVMPKARRRDIARQILRHLEAEICRRGFRSIALETGCDNVEAIGLYEAEGYFPIPQFLGYVGNPISRCFAKRT